MIAFNFTINQPLHLIKKVINKYLLLLLSLLIAIVLYLIFAHINIYNYGSSIIYKNRLIKYFFTFFSSIPIFWVRYQFILFLLSIAYLVQSSSIVLSWLNYNSKSFKSHGLVSLFRRIEIFQFIFEINTSNWSNSWAKNLL